MNSIWFYIFLALLSIGGLIAYLLLLRRFLSLRKKGEGKPRMTLAVNILLSLILFLLFFFAGETWYRFFEDSSDAFALSMVSKRWGERHYQFNNLKVRDDHDYSLKRTTNKRRISFFGDSFTAGHGVKDPKDRFANLLETRHPAWEVHALAANGDEIPDHLNHLQGLLNQGYEFGEIVLVYNLNDLSPYLSQTEALYAEITSFKEGWGFWMRHSYLINTWGCRWFSVNNEKMLAQRDHLKNGYFGPEWQEGGRPQLDQFVAICRNEGIPLRVVLFPFLRPLDETDPFKELPALLKVYWASRGVPFLNLRPVLKVHKREGLTVNTWDAHPNEVAHELAAREIGEFLEE